MASGDKANASQQVKQLLAALKKHHFWLLLSIVIIASFVVWYSATGELQAAFKLDTAKIDNSFNGVTGMLSQPLRNDKMIGSVEEEQKKIHQQSVDAWNVLYDRQKPLYVWPAEVATIGDLPLDQEIPLGLRADFQQIVLKHEWEKLFLIANPILDGAPKPAEDYVEKVDWPLTKRNEIMNRYIDPDAAIATAAPSTDRVRTAMEDIWIYQNLVEIIRDMNASATDRAQSVIKRVRALEIAQWAIAEGHRNPGVSHPDINGGKPPGRPLTPPNKPNGGHPKDDAIWNGRYVDGENRPIIGGPKSPQPFAEFRQMFVQMRFVMDQNAINELLARCANARFPIVARQVLVKFRDSDTISPQNDPFDKDAFDGYTAVRPNDALVEIRGLIFLYNQADTADTAENQRKLGTGTAPKPAHRKLGIPPLAAPQ